MLKNKAGIQALPISTQEWRFKTKDDLIYIKNINSKDCNFQNFNVLEVTFGGIVTEKCWRENKAEQLWKKGAPNQEGYFTLENSKVSKVMTAINTELIQVKGNLYMDS